MSGRGVVAPGAGRATRVQGREVAFGVVAFVGYLLAAVWAKELSLPGTVLIWFPPAGVAIGVLYLRPRLFPVVLVAELVSTTLVMGVADEFGVVPLAVNTVGIVGAYAIAAWLLHRLDLAPDLRSADDLLRLVLGAFVGSALAAAVGVPVQVWTDLVPADDLARQLAIFWLGDAVAVACITPTVLLVGRPWLGDDGARLRLADDERPGTGWHWLLLVEYLIPAALALTLMSLGDTALRFVYLAFVPVVLIAIRHGVTGAAYSTAALGTVMTAGASVLVSDTLDRSDFQLLMLVLTLTGLITGAVVSARRDVFDVKRRISQIVEATPDMVATVRADGTITYLNPVGRRLLGIGATELPDSHVADFHPDDLAMDLTREAIRLAAQDGTWTGENRLRRADGHVFNVSQVIIAHDDRDGPTFSAVCRDMTDQHRLEDQLRRAAFYDDATGLPNRALLLEQLSRLVDADDRTVRTAILFVDVHNLQRLNEVFGFETGDRVVATIAGRIVDTVRSPDLVARHGGAQFVVALSAVSDEFDAIRLAHRILDGFTDPVPIEGRSVNVTGSIGIAVSEPGDDHLDTLRRAEIALHRAREAGGSRVALYDGGLQVRWRQRQELEADLHHVISTNSWRLAYQPVIDLTDGRIVSAEALLRWTSLAPNRPPTSPFELVRLAEESGAIVPLGREIFRRACMDAHRWHDTGQSPHVSINVSALQLRDAEFVGQVRATAEASDLDPSCVVIELTETVMADGAHGEVGTLRRLRDIGFLVALDDFGTGYSSLSGLRDLPIDIVKLDRTFITDLGVDPAAAALVEAVVRLADGLSLTVVAEGVERDDQLALLVELGCHQVQGHLFSPAVSPDEVAAMLQREGALPPGTRSA